MQKINFQNSPSTSTPLNTTNMNALQTNVEDVFNGTQPMGNIKIDTVTTKNKFNINGEINANGFSGNIGLYNTVSGNTMTCNGNSSSSQYYGQTFTDMNGKTLTLSAKLVSKGTGDGGRIAIFDNGSFKTEKQLGTVGGYQSITYTGTSNNVVVAFCTAGGTGAQLTDIQVELNSSQTNYAEFQGVGYVSGKNSNGNYIKYDDGTLIQWNTIAKSNFQSSSVLSTTVQGINWYRSNNPSIVFPTSFIDTNYSINLTVLEGTTGSRFILPETLGKTATGFIAQLMGVEDFTSSGTAYTNLTSVIYMAIGRWK